MINKIIGKIIAVLLIFAAIYIFEWNDLNMIIVSILLFLSGATILTEDAGSEFWQDLRKFLRRANIALAILFILKMLILG